MPRLLLFVPCEKVSFDSSDQAASVINILQGFEVDLPVGGDKVPSPLPRGASLVLEQHGKASLPLRWVVFALWQREEADKGKQFEQFCRLTTPSGKVSVDAALEFKMTKTYQRNTVHVVNFPVDEAGEYSLKLFLREQGKKKKTELAAYPMVVTHTAASSSKSRQNRKKKRKRK